ncbi:hypothetical protein BC628DRAFT_899281 [Trametes gibbosa]|nr:hypothetical protein BC628DRAFT_899281 [Trametes gibbosa]
MVQRIERQRKQAGGGMEEANLAGNVAGRSFYKPRKCPVRRGVVRGAGDAAVRACGAPAPTGRTRAPSSIRGGSVSTRRHARPLPEMRRPINETLGAGSPAASDEVRRGPGIELYSQCASLQRQAAGFSWRAGGHTRVSEGITRQSAPGGSQKSRNLNPGSNPTSKASASSGGLWFPR